MSQPLTLVFAPSRTLLPSFAWSMGIAISLVLHLAVLFLQFVFPDVSSSRDNTIEMILVNENNQQLNPTASVLANAALEGGGEAEEGRMASPLVRDDETRNGDHVRALDERVRQQETQLTKKLLAAQTGMREFDVASLSPEERQEWEASFAAIARRQAEIEKNIRDYNARPRKYFDGPHTNSHEAALYVNQWRNKVEEWGNNHYPAEAKGKVYGDVTLTVELNKEGQLITVQVEKSSGHPVLDRAALESVRRSGPFGSFTPSMAGKMDILVITRTWTYSAGEMATRGVL